jgi:hypothetical protein
MEARDRAPIHGRSARPVVNASPVNRLMRFTRSVLVLVTISVAVPAALVKVCTARFGGASPLSGVHRPTDVSWGQIRGVLTRRLDEQLIADIVIRSAIVVCWLAVVVFVVTVVVETVHMARHGGHHLPDVRGLGITQRRARVIAAGLLVVLPALAPRPVALALDGVADRSTIAAVHGAPSAEPPADRGPLENWPARPGATPPSVGETPSRYVVRAGDSIYAIADRFGGPTQREIDDYANRLVDLNLGRLMTGGQRFTNAAFVDIGWELELPEGSTETAIADGSPVHTVAPGESLWSIADAELDDGARWPEIYEINRERVFPDGRTFDDPDLIRPGWELTLPSVPPTIAAPNAHGTVEPPAASLEQPAEPTPALHDSLPNVERSPAREHDALRDRTSPLPDNVWVDTHGARTNEPDGALAGVAAVGGATYASFPDGRDRARLDDALDNGLQASVAPELLTMQRALMLSVGILTLLACRRRQRMRQARPRARIPDPAEAPRRVERSLRLVGGGERLARVEVAVRHAALALVGHHARLLAVMSAPDGEVELVATGPTTLDAPWESSDAASVRWVLPAGTQIEPLVLQAHGVAPPSPTLVQLGVDERGREVYVDLEAVGALEVGGSVSAADAIVAAVAATLASSVLAEVVQLISVGVDPSTFLSHRLHRAVDDPAAAITSATEAVGSTATMPESTFELRTRAQSGDAWEPAVVLVGSSARSVDPRPLANGVALISAARVEGRSSQLVPDGELWVLRPAGLRFQPIGLEPADAIVLSELIDVPPASIDVGSFTGDGDTSAPARGHEHPRRHTRSAAGTSEPWALMVRLLGPVSVVGREGALVEFERSKTRELVAWLATHRGRSTRSNARTALWEHDVRDATFSNVVSEARRALARCVPPPDGDEWLGRTLTDSLPLHPLVTTDADLIERAVAVARAQEPAEAIATLRPLVQLIAGLPFEGTSYLWPDAEGLTSHLVLLATTATAELAAYHLEVGDVEGVFAATGRGLGVLPGHEELIGLRMRAHARAGDHAGVRQEWESYERMIMADPWSDGEPSPKLVDLRHELLHLVR